MIMIHFDNQISQKKNIKHQILVLKLLCAFHDDYAYTHSVLLNFNMYYNHLISKSFEPRREKTGLRGFRPGLTQTDLYSHRSRLEA